MEKKGGKNPKSKTHTHDNAPTAFTRPRAPKNFQLQLAGELCNMPLSHATPMAAVTQSVCPRNL